MEMNDKIVIYLKSLFFLSSLDKEEIWDLDKDITEFIPRAISDTVIILGSDFDEKMHILISEGKMLLNAFHVKINADVKFPEIFSKKNINKIISDNIDLFMNTDGYVNDYDELRSTLEDNLNNYFQLMEIKNITMNHYQLTKALDEITQLVDRTYILSKDLSVWTTEKILYLYNNGKGNIFTLCYYAIDLIIYLIKYYIIMNFICRYLLIIFIRNLEDIMNGK